MSASTEVDQVVRESLADFFRWLCSSQWRGREREAVSLYAFGFLQRRFGVGRVLHDPAQIGIEVAVPGIDSVNRKQQVCKDLVVWGAPGMTCWDESGAPTKAPLAILEWKVSRKGQKEVVPSKYDLDWLGRFSCEWRELAGYALILALVPDGFLDVTRVSRGELQPGW